MLGMKNKAGSLEVSSVNVTDDAVAYPKFWVAALTNMNAERKTVEKLKNRGFESFVAIKKEKHQWSDRVKTINKIVIPMVIFVHVNEQELSILQNSKITKKILGYPGSPNKPVHIPDDQIERFQFMLKNSDTPVELDNMNLAQGESVKVVSGPLTGLTGTLIEPTKGKSYITICIDGLGTAKTLIGLDCVERISD